MPRGELFDPIFGATELGAALSDHAWITALIEVERALARAQAAVGVLDEGYADAVDAAGRELAGQMDPGQLGRAAAAGGNPVIPLVSALRRVCAETGVPAAAVHKGATSQDILDNALSLLAQRTGTLVVDELRVAADSADRKSVV